MAIETRATWCGLCHVRCGLLMEFDSEKAVAVKGDPEHPTNRGRTCRRGRLMLEHLHHPERLNHPLRRIGARGSGRWQKVSWAEAADEVACALETLRERYGAESLAFSRGTYRTYHWDARRFLNLFGSPNMTGANAVCHCPSVAVETAMCGSMAYQDVAHAACVVILGSARSVSSPVTHWIEILSAGKRGARVITVDPRRTKEARLADLWLQVRPGTDVVLLLAWIDVICREGLYDRTFVERWTDGFEEIREMAAAFPPSRAAEITWVPEEKIVNAARLYATTKPAVILWGQALDKQGPNSERAVQVRTVLRAITGNLDVVGGERFGASERAGKVISEERMELNEALPETQRSKMIGAARHPLFSFDAWERMVRALSRLPEGALGRPATGTTVCAPPHDVFGAMRTGEPYPVRALICQASNPLLTLADPARTLEALKALDLLVVMDYYMTPSAALADYVFPAASTVERDDIQAFGAGCIANPRAMDPLFERRSDYEFWMELGRRLGQAEHWPWDSAEAACDHRLSPVGLTFRELASRKAFFDGIRHGLWRNIGFGTPSGKVELCPSIFTELGCNPRPGYAPVREDPDGSFPLLLITGCRFEPMMHSEQRQWSTARKRWPDPLVSLHPQTVEEIGVADGDWVRLETSQGSIRQRVRVDENMHPRVVDSQHGWWFPERKDPPGDLFGVLESNVNALCSDAPDWCAPGTGGWTLTGIPCRIVPE